MITFQYNNKSYPYFIKNGYHAQYILPVASKVCIGSGIDIGCGKKEFAFPNALLCDLSLNAPWNDALHLPLSNHSLDFVFSSHCLEHIPNYYNALTEWSRVIKTNGVMFLYLPSIECEYWRPANNKKHMHILYPEDIKYDLESLGFKDIFYSGVDLAYSYAIFGVKA